jgi:hypothetical protein
MVTSWAYGDGRVRAYRRVTNGTSAHKVGRQGAIKATRN